MLVLSETSSRLAMASQLYQKGSGDTDPNYASALHLQAFPQINLSLYLNASRELQMSCPLSITFQTFRSVSDRASERAPRSISHGTSSTQGAAVPDESRDADPSRASAVYIHGAKAEGLRGTVERPVRYLGEAAGDDWKR